MQRCKISVKRENARESADDFITLDLNDRDDLLHNLSLRLLPKAPVLKDPSV